MQYKVMTPIQHDGTRYEFGETINLSNQEAAELLRLKAVQPIDQPFSKEVHTPWGDNP